MTAAALPPLEEPCAACGGTGNIPQRRDKNVIQFGGPCDTCRGVGLLPTKAGKQILQLIRNARRAGDF